MFSDSTEEILFPVHWDKCHSATGRQVSKTTDVLVYLVLQPIMNCCV